MSGALDNLVGGLHKMMIPDILDHSGDTAITRGMWWKRGTLLAGLLAVPTLGIGDTGIERKVQPLGGQKTRAATEGRKFSHEETLRWIGENKAWRLARKNRPIWARPVEPEEVGKEFQTADHVREKAPAGVWLCVGVVGEPWFQAFEKIEGKYERDGQETRTFAFDGNPRTYRKYKPKGTIRNWVAQVKGPGIAGFYVRPGYDPARPLYSPPGGYVVKDDVADPYRDEPKDVWLVQQSLFESTYEIIRDRRPGKATPKRR